MSTRSTSPRPVVEPLPCEPLPTAPPTGAAQDEAQASATARRLFLESGEYTLDLRVAGFAKPEVGSVAGFCAHEGGRPVANAPAYLLCDGRLAGAGTTSDRGEFEFAGRLDSPVELWVFDESDTPITVRLHQAEAKPPVQ